MTFYSRNATRSRMMLDAANANKAGAVATKMVGDGAMEYLSEGVSWNQTALGQLARLLGEYTVELLRMKLHIWVDPKAKDSSKIYIVTGTLSKGIYVGEVSSGSSDSRESLRTGKINTKITSAATISIDLDSSMMRAEQSELWSSGAAEGKAKVDYGYGFGRYRPDVLMDAFDDTEIPDATTTWFNLIGKQPIGPMIMNWPAGVKVTSVEGWNLAIARLTQEITELRMANDEKIEESAQQRLAYTGLGTTEDTSTYIPF